MAIPPLESYQKRVEKVRVHVIDCVNINADLIKDFSSDLVLSRQFRRFMSYCSEPLLSFLLDTLLSS